MVADPCVQVWRGQRKKNTLRMVTTAGGGSEAHKAAVTVILVVTLRRHRRLQPSTLIKIIVAPLTAHGQLTARPWTGVEVVANWHASDAGPIHPVLRGWVKFSAQLDVPMTTTFYSRLLTSTLCHGLPHTEDLTAQPTGCFTDKLALASLCGPNRQTATCATAARGFDKDSAPFVPEPVSLEFLEIA
jgi:hypothetical protein